MINQRQFISNAIIAIAFAIIPNFLFADCKFEKIIQGKGQIVKLQDYPIEGKLGQFGEIFIRKVTVNGISTNFLTIGQVGNNAFIHHNDLNAVITSLEKLKNELVQDLAGEVTMIENKYVTDDNLKIGYMINSKKEPNWFIISRSFKYPMDKLNADNMISLFKLAKEMCLSIK